MSSEHQVAMTPALRAGEQRVKTGCCIVGGGPAGLMLGYLLARAGVEVVVVEKHADFHRDFRGDTVHPSTLQVLDELGLLDDFLKIPHSELREFHGMVGRRLMRAADFRNVPGRCKFIAIMPQWDFLPTDVKKSPKGRQEDATGHRARHSRALLPRFVARW
jgi:choline dehydrogenase-like flavoprotein